MSNINGSNLKDFFTNTLAILNDEFTDNETVNSFLKRIFFCSCFKNVKKYFVCETFVSIRIYIGIVLHFIELLILMINAEKSSPGYIYGFSASIFLCLLILVAMLIVYDVFLVKRINKNKYHKDFDSCCSSKSKSKAIFKLSILFLVLFKFLSLLVSIDIFTNSLSDIDETGLNYFDKFFFSYGLCDFGLTVFGIFLALIKLFLDFLISHCIYLNGKYVFILNAKTYSLSKWKANQIANIEYNQTFQNMNQLTNEENNLDDHTSWSWSNLIVIFFNSQFLMVTFVSIGGRYLNGTVLTVVLVVLISILVLATILLILSCIFLGKSRKFKLENNMALAIKNSNQARRLNFFTDFLNLIYILGLCIIIAISVANLYSCKECYNSVLSFKSCCSNNKYCFEEDAVGLRVDCGYWLKYNITDADISGLRH
jgi:hypothetical protein